MEKMPLEDLALLEILHGLDEQQAFNAIDTGIRQRLFDSGLLQEGPAGPELSLAGIELRKSLEHRDAACQIASTIVADTDEVGEVAAAVPTDGGHRSSSERSISSTTLTAERIAVPKPRSGPRKRVLDPAR